MFIALIVRKSGETQYKFPLLYFNPLMSTLYLMDTEQLIDFFFVVANMENCSCFFLQSSPL